MNNFYHPRNIICHDVHLLNNYPQAGFCGIWIVVFVNGQRYAWMVILLGVFLAILSPVACALGG
jgi:hypothetical protein